MEKFQTGVIKMNTANDEKILGLTKKITDKKASLKATERLVPTTNCSIELDGQRYNILTLAKEQIISLLVKLNSYKISAEQLGVLEDYIISGYSVENWITDLRTRLAVVDRKTELERLAKLERELKDLLSNEKKVELTIEELASQVNL
jgi:hypothetical protein